MASLRNLLTVIVIFLSFLLESHGNRKAKRTKEHLAQPPRYEIHQSDSLPNDLQVSAFLLKGENKEFSYWSSIGGPSLAFTITTCSSPVQWTVKFRKNNSTGKSSLTVINNEMTYDMKTISLSKLKGLYTLYLGSTERDTYVHLYVSTEPGGPQALQNERTQDIRLFKKQRIKQLAIRWDPTLVDPHGTDYCLVVSTRQHYTTLCAAQYERFGLVRPRQISNQPEAASQTVTNWEKDNFGDQNYPQVTCVGPKTLHYTLTNLRQGQGYYFDLFAINRLSNLTYPHGTAFTIFDKNAKPTALRDGKPMFFNLKKVDGRAVFRFKIGKKSGDSLSLYIIPCGGAIDVEIALKGEIVESKRRIEGFGKVEVQKPKKGARYYIKVFASNREELLRTAGVEMYITTHPSAKIPLPSMPAKPVVQEYISMRTCDSVTVGWEGINKTNYCVAVKEGKLRDMEGYRLPNQCGLENRLKKSADFTAKYCRYVENSNHSVIIQTLSQLKPKRNYIVQVTVKKPGGKTLSYDLLQVKTKPICH